MVDLHADALDDALELFHLAFRALVNAPDRALAQRGLGRAHHRILYLVRRRPGITASALVQALGVTKQATSAPLRTLLEQRLVAAASSQGDKRVKLFQLTPAGRAFERRLTGHQRLRLHAAFSAAGHIERQAWASVMRSIAAPGMNGARR